MTSVRKRKTEIMQASLCTRVAIRAQEDKLWDQMSPVGREFGSPDFERLMEEDFHKGVGPVDPALKIQFAKGINTLKTGRYRAERQL
jgi:hypothetical protein